MPQIQGQFQTQTQTQQMRLSPLQVLTVRLLESSLVELEQKVRKELDENLALESGRDDAPKEHDEYADPQFDGGDYDGDSDSEYDGDDERDVPEKRDSALDDYSSPDDVPSYLQQRMENEHQERPLGETVSFIDDLLAQMIDYDLDEQQQTLVTYLIGTLDDNGFIDMPLSRIVDDMMIRHNIYTDEEELEKALHVLQQFDPAGIGARNSQECLLLQIDRKLNDRENLLGNRYFYLEQGRELIANHYDLFVNNNVEMMKQLPGLGGAKFKAVMEELRKLNLHPGLALCESASDRVQTVIPDYVIETDLYGNISFHLNKGDVPSLHVSREYLELMKAYDNPTVRLSRHDKERAMWTRSYVDRAQNFIDAIAQRRETMTRTMKAIIALQREFILSQDPNDLHQVILKDIAEKAGYDISTVSRVCKGKYCEIDGNLHPMSVFLRHLSRNAKGEEVDADSTKEAIRNIILNEDKRAPLSDEAISILLSKQNINIKRRTVVKYRNELGIPPKMKRICQ